MISINKMREIQNKIEYKLGDTIFIYNHLADKVYAHIITNLKYDCSDYSWEIRVIK